MNEKLKKALVAMGVQAELTEDTVDALLTKCSELQTELNKAKEELAEKDEEATEEQARIDAILALGNKHNLGTEAVEAIKAKTTLADFTAKALDAVSVRAEANAKGGAQKPAAVPLGVPVAQVLGTNANPTASEKVTAAKADLEAFIASGVKDPAKKSALARAVVKAEAEAKKGS